MNITPEQTERIVTALERIAAVQTIHVGYILVAGILMGLVTGGGAWRMWKAFRQGKAEKVVNTSGATPIIFPAPKDQNP